MNIGDAEVKPDKQSSHAGKKIILKAKFFTERHEGLPTNRQAKKIPRRQLFDQAKHEAWQLAATN
jgi:hypothetical protein